MRRFNWKNSKIILCRILKAADSFFRWFSPNLAAVVLVVAMLAWISASFFYKDVSILYPVEEIMTRISEFKVKQGKYRDRIDKLKFKKKLLKRHLDLGNSFLNDDRHKPAKKEFERALKIDPLNIKAQTGLSKTGIYEDFADRKNYSPETVKRRIDAILKENGKDPHANALLGNLYLRLDLPEKARRHYKTAIESGKKIASAYFGMGYLHQKYDNDPDRALEMYEKAVDISPWNTRYLANMAGIRAEKKHFKKAVETYKKMIRLDPDFILSYCGIARAYIFAGKLKMARKYLEQRVLTMLNDPDKTEADKNRRPWVFRKVYISKIPQKRYYALCLAAGIAAAQKEDRKAASFRKKAAEQAEELDPSKKQKIDDLVKADAGNL